MAVTQYIGSRYVPLFADPIEWSKSNTYEPLTIVIHEGNSYTSRQAVPKDIDITNETFWALTGNYNAQVELYRRETAAARAAADDAQADADAAQADIDTLLPKVDFSAENTVKKYVDDSVAAVQTLAMEAQNDIDTLLPKIDFSAENTVKQYIDRNKTRVLSFNTVADMQAATNLAVGMTCHTNGFHTSGDNGAAYYMVSDTGTPNSMDILALQNGLFATLVITNNTTAPEMFGAHGDGNADDSKCLKRCLELTNIITLQEKNYYCAETLTLEMGQKILGNQNGYGETTLSFPKDMNAIEINGRGVELGCFRIETIEGSTGTAIGLIQENNHWIKLHDLNIFYFAKGFSCINGALWDATIDMVRINFANIAVELSRGFNIYFNNLYTNRCDTALSPGTIRAKFTSCNFGITGINAIVGGTNVNLTFDSCNFECDSEVNEIGIIFRLDSGWYNFDNCMFFPNITSQNTYFFAGTTNNYSVIFKNCRCTPYDTAFGETNFFAKAYPIGGNYNFGVLKFFGCTNAFPKPDYYSASVSNVLDFDSDGIVHFWSTAEQHLIDSGRIKNNALLFNDATHKLGYFNGTAIVYFE